MRVPIPFAVQGRTCAATIGRADAHGRRWVALRSRHRQESPLPSAGYVWEQPLEQITLGLAAHSISSHANWHNSLCRMNSLLFGSERAEQTSSHIAINIKGSFIQPSRQKTGWDARTPVSPLVKFPSHQSTGERTLCPSHTPLGAVPFLVQWMFGMGTGTCRKL